MALSWRHLSHDTLHTLLYGPYGLQICNDAPNLPTSKLFSMYYCIIIYIIFFSWSCICWKARGKKNCRSCCLPPHDLRTGIWRWEAKIYINSWTILYSFPLYFNIELHETRLPRKHRPKLWNEIMSTYLKESNRIAIVLAGQRIFPVFLFLGPAVCLYVDKVRWVLLADEVFNSDVQNLIT